MSCVSPVCERIIYAKGMCQTHYGRSLRGDAKLDKPVERRGAERIACRLLDCGRWAVGDLKLCKGHRERLRRNGDRYQGWDEPLGTATQNRTEETRTLDPRTGYVYLSIPGDRRDLEHRIVVERDLGRLLRSDEHVHHKNGQRDDNRLDNLEVWTVNHPRGQRAEDLVEYAKEILTRYEPEALHAR